MSKWYLREGPKDDIIISSRVRLARNVTDFPFQSRISPQQQKQLNNEVQAALENLNLGDNKLSFIKADGLHEYELASLTENHIISPDFANNPKGRLLVLSDSRDISIMVGEEDHLRIQVLKSGLSLDEVLNTANMLDDALDQSLNYAFSERFGFLTACPSNLGTGLRASVMMHLPALTSAGYISKLSSTISKFGLIIRGMYGEGSKAKGSLYQISNQITLGITEKEAVDNLKNIIIQIEKQEKELRKSLFNDTDRLNDMVYRSIGVLKNAFLLSSDEAMGHISNLRLGISMGIVKDISTKTVNEIAASIGSGSICSAAKKLMPPNERDKLRAQTVKKILNQGCDR